MFPPFFYDSNIISDSSPSNSKHHPVSEEARGAREESSRAGAKRGGTQKLSLQCQVGSFGWETGFKEIDIYLY